MTVVIYGECPGCGRHTGLAGTLCYSSDVALGGGRRSGDPGERVVACQCGSVARPRERTEYVAPVDSEGRAAPSADPLAPATPRPWRADGEDILDAEGSFVVETFGPDEPETLLIVRAVNEYEALLAAADLLAKAVDTFDDLDAALGLLRHPVLAEACSIAAGASRAILGRLDTIRGTR